MWLEKPHEEEVCKELSDNYAKLHELQKHSEQMMNRSRYVPQSKFLKALNRLFLFGFKKWCSEEA